MLEALCGILNGIGSVDDGVECVLNEQALNGLVKLIENVYGTHAADVVKAHFIERDNRFTCPSENIEQAFRACLTGSY